MTPGTTHHPACWRDPKHHECAVAAVVRLVDIVRQLEHPLGADIMTCAECGEPRPHHRADCWIGIEIDQELEGLE